MLTDTRGLADGRAGAMPATAPGPIASGPIARLAAWLGGLRLDQRFALTGGVVTLIGMAVVGLWVNASIAENVTRNSAFSAAIYMETLIAPLSQQLEGEDSLPEAAVARLHALLAEPSVANRIVAVKIWKKGGLVAFSSDRQLIGRRFAEGPMLRGAWAGRIMSAFDDLGHQEDDAERARGLPLLEIYNPIHSIVTGEIIAVAELYHNAQALKRDLFAATATSWVIVAAVMLATFGVLFGIVRNGSRTIARQYDQLAAQFGELGRVMEQNRQLGQRIQSASRRAGEVNERYLRRLGAELHDGPAQALALATLRLGALADPKAAVEREQVRRSLEEALRDIRLICRGLTLPELEGKSIAQVLEAAVKAHRRRTGSEVALAIGEGLAGSAPPVHSTSICVYRFVQEGLMNAYKHAQGRAQRVSCRRDGTLLECTVEDSGEGFDAATPTGRDQSLGLAGLRERVESIGGTFRIDSRRGQGTRLSLSLEMAP